MFIFDSSLNYKSVQVGKSDNTETHRNAVMFSNLTDMTTHTATYLALVEEIKKRTMKMYTAKHGQKEKIRPFVKGPRLAVVEAALDAAQHLDVLRIKETE